MIISIIGGVGSGKSISCVREVMQSQNFPITNFNLKKTSHHRLRYEDIITKKNKGTEEKPKYIDAVNWDFWDDIRTRYKNFSIYFDEAHNVVGSRSSMTKKNQLMSNWISQIRKILSDSPTNHIFIVTQKPRRIDVNFRELTNVVITCQKLEVRNKVFIIQKYYDGFDGYEMGIVKGKEYYLANPYFKFYDTHEMIKFAESEEFV